jgi:hypothetical protein
MRLTIASQGDLYLQKYIHQKPLEVTSLYSMAVCKYCTTKWQRDVNAIRKLHYIAGLLINEERPARYCSQTAAQPRCSKDNVCYCSASKFFTTATVPTECEADIWECYLTKIKLFHESET